MQSKIQYGLLISLRQFEVVKLYFISDPITTICYQLSDIVEQKLPLYGLRQGRCIDATEVKEDAFTSVSPKFYSAFETMSRLNVTKQSRTRAWTKSHVDQVKVCFTWTIDNISRLLNQKKSVKVIRSPNFFSNDDEETQWYLEFFPRGKEDNKDFITLFLTLDCSDQSEVIAAYKFSVISANDQITSQYSFTEEARFVEGDSRGKESLITRSNILDKSKSLVMNDSLTVECDITASKVVHTSQCSKNHSLEASLQANLCEELSLFVGDVRFSDVVFYIRGREFPAHKVILAARSPVFLSMFEETPGTKHVKQHRIEIKDVEPDIFHQVLKFIYTGRADHLDSTAAPVLAVADKYGLKQLKSMCEENLILNMNSTNVGSLYMLADIHSAEFLKKEALKIMQQNGGLLMINPQSKNV